jgi:Flp pilus assembly protein TadB
VGAITLFVVGLSAAAVGAAAYCLTCLSGAGEDPPGVEAGRRRALRRTSMTYRVFEPTVRALADVYARRSPAATARLTHNLELLGVEHWRAEELAAAKQVEAVLIGVAGGLCAALLSGPAAGVTTGTLIALVLPYLLLGTIRKRAEEYMRQVRNRLPYAMDLMALMLEAGAGTLRECMERAGDEHTGQPFGDEIRRTLFGVEKGVSAVDMLRAMDRRLADPDVKDLVLTVTTAEERGISLREALRGLAERMRQRKMQWMEKSAEQAKVRITGPAMVTMFGCLLIVVAPLLLHAFGTAQKDEATISQLRY